MTGPQARGAALVVALLALASLPWWVGGTYYVNIASQILIYAIFALGLNVLVMPLPVGPVMRCLACPDVLSGQFGRMCDSKLLAKYLRWKPSRVANQRFRRCPFRKGGFGGFGPGLNLRTRASCDRVVFCRAAIRRWASRWKHRRSSRTRNGCDQCVNTMTKLE